MVLICKKCGHRNVNTQKKPVRFCRKCKHNSFTSKELEIVSKAIERMINHE